MATETQQKTTTELAREVLPDNPELALKAAIAETEKLKIDFQREQKDANLMADITFGTEGLVANNLASLWRYANMLSRSDMVPEQFRQKPENCLIVLQMAQRCKVDVFMFMQNSYVVHGKPGIEAKLAIAMLNMSGKITGRIRFLLEGENSTRKCTATVTDKETGESVSMTVDWKMVQAEKWDDKPGSKWKTMPEIMFPYRSAMFLIRTHYPEVLMGMTTVDELEDIATNEAATAGNEQTDERPAAERLADKLEARLAGNGADTKSEQATDAPDESTAYREIFDEIAAPDPTAELLQSLRTRVADRQTDMSPTELVTLDLLIETKLGEL